MASRIWPRIWVAMRVFPTLIFRWRSRSLEIKRILIAHHLLLGDTIMLAPLMKRIRERYPSAEVTMICNPSFVPLFAKKPYGVTVLPYEQRSLAAHRALCDGRRYDVAFVPGDNRWAWLARAIGADWVVAFADKNSGYKNWAVDEFVEFPSAPHTWGDLATALCDSQEPEQFALGEWEQPPFVSFIAPAVKYCVLHLGASSPHKHWGSSNWQSLIDWLEKLELTIVLTCGRGEEALLRAVDPTKRHRHFAGTLDLAQLWQLLKGAQLLVCPDTGIAHLARIVGTPTVALFGPGSPVVSGPGRFWRASAFVSVFIEDIPCRNQSLLFERDLKWVRHCWRTPQECGNPICMHSISLDHVLRAVSDLGVAKVIA